MVADGLTKGSVPRDALLHLSIKGEWIVEGRSECIIGRRTWETTSLVSARFMPSRRSE